MRGVRLGVVLSLLAACAIPVASFALVAPWIDQVPKWDQWTMIEVWEAHFTGKPVAPLLLAPYHGHLNVVPRILFYLLGLLTGWDLHAELLLLYVTAAGTAAVLLLMLRDSGERSLWLAAPVTLLLFSLTQSTAFLSGYTAGQFLCQLSLAGTIFVLTRPRISVRHVAAAAVLAALATFSWGSGLLAWPLGGVILLVRMPRRWGVWAAWGALLLATALVLRQAGGGNLLALRVLVTRPSFALFALTLLGRPLCMQGFPDASTALALGIAQAVAFPVVLLWTWAQRQSLLVLRWGLFGLSGLGAAALITVPRGGGPLEPALAPHYAIAISPLLLSLIVLAVHGFWHAMDHRGSRLASRAGGGIVLLLLALVGFREMRLARELVPILGSWSNTWKTAGQRLQSGEITDLEIRRTFHPDVRLVREGMLALRRHRLALYRDLPEGDPLSPVASRGPDRMPANGFLAIRP